MTTKDPQTLSLKPIYDYVDNKVANLVTKDDIKHLPTKSEFYAKMDEVMGELKAIREEHTTIGDILTNHENRLHKLESTVFPSSN